jgi:anti-sigma regulatory factor (Ser/Thr protein kinase)
LIGWLPVWALYTTLIVAMHGPPLLWAAFAALRAVLAAALLGLVVHRLTQRFPWPRPFQARFVALHVVGAALYSVAWVGLTSAMESLPRGRFVVVAPAGIVPYLTLGVWLYVMVAGVAYATRATERAAQAEAIAARSQLAALRGQLNPHFLFNALHTVVHLIPREPARAGQAAEQIAALLRTTVEEDRDLVSLVEELAFVERYLDLERLRFADRLRVRIDVSEDARHALVPAYALQTLVENAVRHGATPRIEPTEIAVTARLNGGDLALVVHDTGAGVDKTGKTATTGTGLSRLRERLAVLYGGRARLGLESPAGGGFTASLVVPKDPDA